MVQSFILAHFNYCPLVWYFTSAKQINKMEQIQERALRFITDDYSSSYEKLLKDSNTSTMAIKRVHSLCTEIVKSLNNLNAPCKKDLFHRNVPTYSLRSSNDLIVPRANQTTFGLCSIKYEGAVMWCKCAYCKYANENTDHSWTKYLHFLYLIFDSYAWWLMVRLRLEAVWPGASGSVGSI